MGDMSEFRGLIVVLTFIGVTVLLLAFTPAQLYGGTYEGRTVEPPESWESGDLLYFVDTVNITLDDTGEGLYYGFSYTLDIGGHSTRLIDTNMGEIYIQHYWYWGPFPTGHHNMEWKNPDGTTQGDIITTDELDANWEDFDGRYSIEDEHFKFYGFVSFNETAYSSPSDAYENNELNFLFGIEFDQVNTSVNAWSLMSMLLFFSLPSIHPIINAIIAIPIWISIAYLTFILIMHVMEAIFP